MINQVNIISNISGLTTVPVAILNKLVQVNNICIGSAINDAVLNKETSVVLNIGSGLLSVDLITKQCKFTPSKNLQLLIKKSIDDKVDPLEEVLDKITRDKLIKIMNSIVE